MKPALTPIAFTYKFLCGLVLPIFPYPLTPNPSFCFPVNLVPVRDYLHLLFPLSRTLLTEGKKKPARGLSLVACGTRAFPGCMRHAGLPRLHAARGPSLVACGTRAFLGCMWHAGFPWLHVACRLSLVAESEGCCWLWRAGFPLWRLGLFRSTGSWCALQ